eukprot:TRINITY_DN16504_c0_g1_i2.p1 TRINITY_DN16504_c0_g1~~TRINITY_DN16504_c0_g1_i2.p1  ORF type:complete len:988 (-),score=224.29 TRINITY_DN16504_c0_g1_i2:531-3071(-)
MVWFMGEHSHISMDFDDIISVTLANYDFVPLDIEKIGNTMDRSNGSWLEDMQNTEGRVAAIAEAIEQTSSNEVVHSELSREEAENPKIWAKLCVQNMAKLAKEATTVRRVVEPMFRIFDCKSCWSPMNGPALFVLYDMQQFMEKSGHPTHFLLSMLIKHLDHKNVASHPDMQIEIVEIAAVLARQSLSKASVALVSATCDLAKHLRKCLHFSYEASNLSPDITKGRKLFQSGIEECLVQLTRKIGDSGPVLDMMAVLSENLSSSTFAARTTIEAIYIIAQIMMSSPNHSYKNKAFPEALFHQLLQAMVHQDLETRILAHRVLFVVLVPSSVTVQSKPQITESPLTSSIRRTLSRNASVFSSASALFDKLRSERFPFQDVKHKEASHMNEKIEYFGGTNQEEMIETGECDVRHCTVYPSPTKTHSLKLPGICTVVDGQLSNDLIAKNVNTCTLRLSGNQMALLLSSLWAQAMSADNKPENFEAIATTYSLALLFSRVKSSTHSTLVRSFQLAFTLRSAALDRNSNLKPCHRRSLFSLSTAMLIFAAKTYHCPALIMQVKEAFLDRSGNTFDPYLELIDDNRLKAVKSKFGPVTPYGSPEDDAAAKNSLSAIKIAEEQSTESLVSLIIRNVGKFSEEEASTLKKELLQNFSPDDASALGGLLYMETPCPLSPFTTIGGLTSKEPTALVASEVEDVINEPSEIIAYIDDDGLRDSKNVLSVDQLLESVLDTARHVASISISQSPVSYSELASQCEALVKGKQQKLSVLMGFKQPSKRLLLPMAAGTGLNELAVHNSDQHIDKVANGNHHLWLSVSSDMMNSCKDQQNSLHDFKLPPASPYDNFLKAAGC